MKKFIVSSMLICLMAANSFSQTNNNATSKPAFLLIFRFKSNFVPSSQEAVQTNIKHWQEYMSNLGQSGKLVSGFRPSNQGKTITGTKKITQEGVYISNNELISSFIIINAASMDEAGEIARKCPIFEFDGSVEIRPLMEKAN
jgi:hypothetical protein